MCARGGWTAACHLEGSVLPDQLHTHLSSSNSMQGNNCEREAQAPGSASGTTPHPILTSDWSAGIACIAIYVTK